MRSATRTTDEVWKEGVCEHWIVDLELKQENNAKYWIEYRISENFEHLMLTSFGQENTVLHILGSLLALYNKNLASY